MVKATNSPVWSWNNISLSDGANKTLENSGVQKAISSVLWWDFHEIITDKNVYLSTALYLIYWYHRTKNQTEYHRECLENMRAYFWKQYEVQIQNLLSDTELQKLAKEHVEWWVLVRPTIDICLFQWDNVLTTNREFFPQWPALIGGMVTDDDFDNELQLPASAFAALRVAWKKILQAQEISYGESEDEIHGKYYFVEDKNTHRKIILYYWDLDGHIYKDEVKKMVKPSDPRHTVDTHAFRMELIWDVTQQDDLEFLDTHCVLNLDIDNGGLAFWHHREIVSSLQDQKTYPGIEDISHHEFVRSMINDPLTTYSEVKTRFEKNNNHPETPFPELLPVVRKLIHDLYSTEINEICEAQSFAHIQRNLIDNDLKHCFSDKNKPCPYISSITAVYRAIEFFDIIERIKRDYTKKWKTDTFNPQDPRLQEYAYFFRTKYKNHLDDLLAKFPDEILIPTFEHIWATDLIKARWIPMRFIGLSTEFLYVDEFWQSPVEFLLHDADHSLRMAEEDEKYCEEYGISREGFILQSIAFTKKILPIITLKKTDNEEEKELKKLKKVIIFEVCHEDSRSLTLETLSRAIQTQEWKDIHRESVSLDPEWVFYTRNKETIHQGWVSPLAFVLHKLQHGFFDQVDNQISQIVSPKYRTAEYIAQAAYELLQDVWASPIPEADLDSDWDISYEWLLKRTCSKSVGKTHHTEFRDPAISRHWDGTDI